MKYKGLYFDRLQLNPIYRQMFRRHLAFSRAARSTTLSVMTLFGIAHIHISSDWFSEIPLRGPHPKNDTAHSLPWQLRSWQCHHGIVSSRVIAGDSKFCYHLHTWHSLYRWSWGSELVDNYKRCITKHQLKMLSFIVPYTAKLDVVLNDRTWRPNSLAHFHRVLLTKSRP